MSSGLKKNKGCCYKNLNLIQEKPKEKVIVSKPPKIKIIPEDSKEKKIISTLSFWKNFPKI